MYHALACPAELVEDPSGRSSVLTARVPEKWINMDITTQGEHTIELTNKPTNVTGVKAHFTSTYVGTLKSPEVKQNMVSRAWGARGQVHIKVGQVDLWM